MIRNTNKLQLKIPEEFIAVLFIVFLGVSKCSYSQTGYLDSSFNFYGIAQPAFLKGEGNGILILPDSSILVGGTSINSYFELVKYKSNGFLDSSFGFNGVVETSVGNAPNGPGKIAIDSNGRIIQSGSCHNNNGALCFALIRYNSDGSLDNSFNGNGKVITSLNSLGYFSYGEDVIIQPDGKLIEVGSGQNDSGIQGFGVIRFNQNGSLDNSFGIGGKVVIAIDEFPLAYTGEIQPDGKILIAGYTESSSCPGSFAILRLNNNGSLDLNFGIGGVVLINFGAGGSTGSDWEFSLCTDISLQVDGKILLVGATILASTNLGYISIVRLIPNGSFDHNFGINGKVLTAPLNLSAGGESIALQKDSKIIVVGGGNSSLNNNDIILVRYNPNGKIDGSFGIDGFVFTSIDSTQEEAMAVAIQPDNKIVIAGYSNSTGIVAARYLPGLVLGTIDLSVADNQLLICPNPINSQATFQYTLTKDEQITIELFDVQGKLVQLFITNETRTAGKHEEVLKLNELLLPSGTYIINITNGKNSQGVKVVKE